MILRVYTPTEYIELEADTKTTGQELFEELCKCLHIQEHWWFGLAYRGTEKEYVWIDKSKKALSRFQNDLTNLLFIVKFYPENVNELIETVTIEHFFNYIRILIIKDEISCPADIAMLLASWALQAKYGDYSKEKFNQEFFHKQSLLPDFLSNQYKINEDNWVNHIKDLWLEHQSLDKEKAMLEYLKLAQNLDMYGITYFNTKNVMGTETHLGIAALGLYVYTKDDKLNPSFHLSWSEIKKLCINGTKFIIHFEDITEKFTIRTASEIMSKNILVLGIGNHKLYVRRRNPDPPDIVKMKEEANEMRKNKLLMRSRKEVESQQNSRKLQVDKENDNIMDSERMLWHEKMNLLYKNESEQELTNNSDIELKTLPNVDSNQI
ncbi:hypothetical protein GWI33_021093 [Rhynchophorus ferrugineus]|uniref:FERM domain-containing protein n=1 Tax=Rhynchophorus ferrugineus TaxID=354439 RepID=A0A834HPE2_RHYFE|nr:hypothetical protein GWI33_021093 [Rhynchophorus ferrugineus]